MLVLSRKKNEAIIIADVVTIVVVEIRGDKVRLGIEAPPEIAVHRQEVWNAIQRQTLRDAGAVSQVHVDSPNPNASGTNHPLDGPGSVG